MSLILNPISSRRCKIKTKFIRLTRIEMHQILKTTTVRKVTFFQILILVSDEIDYSDIYCCVSLAGVRQSSSVSLIMK